VTSTPTSPEDRLLALLRQDHPGWRIYKWPVKVKGHGTQEWWWALRHQPPSRQLREVGALGWFARPTILQLTDELSNQLMIFQGIRP